MFDPYLNTYILSDIGLLGTDRVLQNNLLVRGVVNVVVVEVVIMVNAVVVEWVVVVEVVEVVVMVMVNIPTDPCWNTNYSYINHCVLVIHLVY